METDFTSAGSPQCSWADTGWLSLLSLEASVVQENMAYSVREGEGRGGEEKGREGLFLVSSVGRGGKKVGSHGEGHLSTAAGMEPQWQGWSQEHSPDLQGTAGT